MAATTDAFDAVFIETRIGPTLTTIVAHILRALDGMPDQILLSGGRLSRESSWTAAALAQRIRQLAAGLARLGLKPGEHIGLIADNHDHWLIADLGSQAAGLVNIPRGADCSAAEAAFVLHHSGARSTFIQDAELLDAFWPELRDIKGLETIILMQPGQPKSDLGSRRILVLDEILGSDELVVDQDETALATIVYTSGTTGNPKGVRLLHSNVLHNIRILPDQVGLNPKDRYLSFLPTWHTFERTLEYCLLAAGSTIHYSSKAQLRGDMARVRPTILAGVPRLWESLVASIVGKIEKSSGAERRIAETLLRLSRRHCDALRRIEGLYPTAKGRLPRVQGLSKLYVRLEAALTSPGHRLADRKIYDKLRQTMGGELRLVISGGGALPEHVDEFMTRAGIPLLNGYGLTETAPVVSLRHFDRNILTTSGRRLAETEWRVMDEEGKRVLPGGEKGVLWIRGPQVMQGYHANQAATELVLKDGWFSSGDLAILTEEDDLIICGRAKDTIVLRGGENVEPERVEAALIESPFIQDLILVGHGEKHLAALVVPDIEGLLGKFPDLSGKDLASLATSKAVSEFLHGEIARILSPSHGWRIFERVPKIGLLPQAFSTEDGSLTGTLKKKRGVIEEREKDRIQALFSDS